MSNLINFPKFKTYNYKMNIKHTMIIHQFKNKLNLIREIVVLINFLHKKDLKINYF